MKKFKKSDSDLKPKESKGQPSITKEIDKLMSRIGAANEAIKQT